MNSKEHLQQTLPQFSYDLIDLLDKTYPNRCMRKGESLEDHLRYAGKRDVIEMLLSRREYTERKGKEQCISRDVSG